LHDQEVRVVHIQLHTEEEVADALTSLQLTIDVALDFVVLDATTHGDFIEVFIARGRELFVAIVKFKLDSGLGDTSVASFVYQVLHLLSSDQRHARNAHHEADGVEDVGLA
jgi:hypothetical protein